MERLSLRQKERWCHIFAGILLFFTGAMILSAYMIQIVWHLLKNEDPVFVLSRFIHYPIRFIKPILYMRLGSSIISDMDIKEKDIKIRTMIYSVLLFSEYLRTVRGFFCVGAGLMYIEEMLVFTGIMIHAIGFRMNHKNWLVILLAEFMVIVLTVLSISKQQYPINLVREIVFSLYKIPLFGCSVMILFELFIHEMILEKGERYE